jgi:hypothetical protein
MTGQDVINAVSTDMRQMLSSTGANATLIMGWVDRVQKDILQTSAIYSRLMESDQPVQTQPNIYSYTLATPARKVLLVYDLTFDRPLMPIDFLGTPQPLADPVNVNPVQIGSAYMRSTPKSQLNMDTNSVRPEYYNFMGGEYLDVFPAPANTDNACLLQIHYLGRVATITDPTVALTVPDEGLPAIIAGTNALACLYLKRPDEAQMWQQIYQASKDGDAR